MGSNTKLLGALPFVSRTFEGTFKENPFVLDMDANLYIGPADHLARDEHVGIEVVYHFLLQRGSVALSVKELLRNREALLDAFGAFDEARKGDDEEAEFRIFIFCSYDGVLLIPEKDDDIPAGPCGKSINEVKRRLYALCRRLDAQFDQRALSPGQIESEVKFADQGPAAG